ncbi:3-oxoacyl-[acyl-carrier-protein] synthase 3 [Thermodesulfomicrobium sp. WS]|uniref:beta-ketoacyl-ACP synthase III n=1 Tax=Thermodesulfomicrobium sp. WS TaxID=3004129 RepID=UPI0024922DDC|nr:beta-ketoacyl-ACP synthase III [Thermodesulfomicrobium sp. WS]BDV00762.1 3-oxoacyl-[acyl-carrier-protein] synthase 3 [Thermodesulfomicrobium sp. WS]
MQPPCLWGLGMHTPARCISNTDFESIVDTSDEWIVSRTGIRTRYHVEPGETCSTLAVQAARRALADAAISPHEVTHLLVATFTGDCAVPPTACLVARELGIQAPAMDLAAACSGFLYALEVGRGLIALHPDATVLVIGSEVCSSRINFTDRSTCVLFGDGAGAAVLRAAAKPGAPLLRDVILHADGAAADLLTVRGGGSACPPILGATIGPEYFVEMNGREVYKYAVRLMSEVSQEILTRNSLAVSDVDLFIPHQANIRIIEAVARKLDIPLERCFVDVDRLGNTSAASIPIALAEARAQGHIHPGDTVLLASFGGGFTWAAALLQF